ncbi:MAG: hypothetical protein ACI31V_02695 [Bacilli bacterium]
MKTEYKAYLNEEIKSVEWFLGTTPYIFVCCDDEKTKKYFTEELKHKIKSLTDYSLNSMGEDQIKNELTNNHILLLNFEEKAKEYKHYLDQQDIKKYGKIRKREDGTEECYGLIRFREHFHREGNRHTIVIVGNRNLHRRISECLPDLSTVSEFLLISEAKEYKTEKRLTLSK